MGRPACRDDQKRRIGNTFFFLKKKTRVGASSNLKEKEEKNDKNKTHIFISSTTNGKHFFDQN